MKLEATSIEDLFVKSGEHEELIRLIDKTIRETAPDLQRNLFSSQSITMVGYGEMFWEKDSNGDAWPLISLAPQKNSVNLYIAAEKEGIPLPQYFIDSFGKTAIGKSCIRIRSIKKFDPEILKELVRETILWADLKYKKYGLNGVISN